MIGTMLAISTGNQKIFDISRGLMDLDINKDKPQKMMKANTPHEYREMVKLLERELRDAGNDD